MKGVMAAHSQLFSQKSSLTLSWVTGILPLAACCRVPFPLPAPSPVYAESFCQQSWGEETVSWGEWEVIPNYECIIPAFYFKPLWSHAWIIQYATWLSTWLVNLTRRGGNSWLGEASMVWIHVRFLRSSEQSIILNLLTAQALDSVM